MDRKVFNYISFENKRVSTLGASLKRNHLSILSSDEIYNMHIATLEVLERTGVLVREKRALKLLDQAGAIVDYKKNLVKVPAYLVEEAVAKTQKSFIWHARNPKKKH